MILKGLIAMTISAHDSRLLKKEEEMSC